MNHNKHVPSRDNVPQPIAMPHPKLGLATARAIYADLLKNPMPSGTLLGSEATLREHYDVSRGAFREAVRILEYHGVVEVVRGPHGGLAVSIPSSEAASRAVALYASSSRVGHHHVLELRVAIETEVAGLAATSSDSWPSSLADVIGHLDSCHAIHGYIARRGKNRALEFLVEILTDLTPDTAQADAEADHLKLIRAIETGSADAARKAMREHILSGTTNPTHNRGEQ